MLPLLLAAATATISTFDSALPASPAMRCSGACSLRYRLAASGRDRGSVKERALSEDGGKCDVVGATRCLSQPTPILRWRERPIETLRSSLGSY